MEKITSDEIRKRYGERYVDFKGKARSPLIDKLLELKVGDILFISKVEWESYGYAKASTPGALIHSSIYQRRSGHLSRLAKAGMKFSARTVSDGWLMKRVDDLDGERF